MPLGDVLVTVLLPIKDCYIDHLKVAVESVTHQTFDDFEFLIINESPCTEVQKYLKSISDKDLRIKILIPKGCRNLPGALNFGLKQATGQFIARMDADDVAVPERFEKQVNFLRANSEISIVGSNVELIDYYGNFIKVRSYPSSQRQIKRSMNFLNPVAHPAAMIRTSALLEIGGYDESFDAAEDYELWFRLMRSGYKFANLQESLLFYRIGNVQARNNKDWMNVLKIKLKNLSFDFNSFLTVLGLLQNLLFLIIPRFVLNYFYKFR